MKLEYVGGFHPWDEARGGIAATVAAIRAQRPGITDREVEQVIQRILNERVEKRYPGHIIHRFGRDILPGDLTQLPAWRWLHPDWQRRLPRYPLDGGALLTGDARDVQRAVYGALDPSRINRASLIKPAGLSATYVWRNENDWLQEVADADAAVLRAAKDAVFRNPERFGRWVEPRSWVGDAEPSATYRFDNEDDAKAFERNELTRQPHWPGAALTKTAG